MEAKRILVVEDNPVNSKLMKALLQTMGHEAVFATSGEEAVEFAGSRPFDLVFMDINLPGIDGIEAMKRIRRARAADEGRGTSDHATAFVALTAHAMKNDAERFIAEGMVEVITKPIELERFFEILGRFAPRKIVEGSADVADSWSGIDEARGLLLLGGDRRLLADMLDLFSTTYAGFPRELREVLEKEDLDEARRLVHGLKGSAANLGLSEVAAAAAGLEARLAVGETLPSADPSIVSLGLVLETVLESIRGKVRP